ncbi:flagellar biosynthetic protein FliR [Natranaerofaba carboxydovora]|uniref:flagellar biosynthetic protein FliR n=1 Tax=Natranaerofaba carboxydovora TaxID=2742683 RepID=UPI001F146717|nr:flagellar biosynthetic protein FliR [Natranaerofaba carboxydovora]UMZ73377.1 Bacterial export protein, family 1 [Natranaerofaba carboxydovora]
MEFAEWLVDQAAIFLLLTIRMTGLFLSAPVLGSDNIPARVKVGVSLLFSIIIFPTIAPEVQVFYDPIVYIGIMVSELLIGLGIGLVASILFASIQVAGQLIDMQMGFAIVNVLDPQSGIQFPLMGYFKYVLAILIYFTIDGHHLLIGAVYESYEFLLPGQYASFVGGGEVIMSLLTETFTLALRVGAPVLGVLFLTNIILGLLARSVPQMNVFIVGLPIKVFVGFIGMILLMPVYAMILDVIFESISGGILDFLRALV